MAKEIVMTDKSLRSFAIFVSVALKHFTRLDVINQLRCNSIKYYECVYVCILILLIRHANRIFSTTHYIVSHQRSVWLYHIFHYVTIDTEFGRKVIGHEMGVWYSI